MTRRLAWAVRVIRFLSGVVPAAERADWRREWEAELACHLDAPGTTGRRQSKSIGWLLGRLASAGQYALWLRATSIRGPRRRAGVWNGTTKDFAYTVRSCVRAPLFSLTAVLTLALGVGLISAILSFADGYLFRPLPFPGADRTYYVRDPNAQIASFLLASDLVALKQSPLAGYGFVEWGSADGPNALHLDGQTIPAFSYEVSRGFRTTLEVPLLAGRDFHEEDHREGAPLVAWISHRFWQRAFGGDWAVVNRVVSGAASSGAVDVRIVGILSPRVTTFDINNRPPDLVVPSQAPPVVGPYQLANPLVLLPPEVPPDRAIAEISAVLQAAAPAKDGRPRVVRLVEFDAAQRAGGMPTARVLFAGAFLVLVLAAMNLVHLLLGRGESRSTEVATRIALGASRWRVVRAFAIESLVLGATGTGLGLLGGWMLSTAIAARVPELPTAGRNLALVPMIFDGRVVAISAMLGLLAAMVGGLWPARRAWRGSLASRPRTQTVGSRRLARIILASELAVVTVVSVGAVFAGLGIHRYLNQPLGFDYRERLRVFVSERTGRLTPAQRLDAIHAIRSVSGVEAAGLETASVRGEDSIEVPGRSINSGRITSPTGVPPGLFEAWGMRLVSGRWFEPAEHSGSDIAVVDTVFATLAWPDRDPLGESVRTGAVLRRVVGVVESQRWRLDGDPQPAVFVPVPDDTGQLPIVAWAPGVDAGEIEKRIARAVAAVVPGASVEVTPLTFDVLFARSIGEARFQAPVVAAFGVLGAVLAVVGVFGIVSFLVQQRTREFGIRIALGARKLDIGRAVIRDSLQPALYGLAAGVMGAWALESVVRSTVFGWPTSGGQAIAIVAVGVIAVAVVAATLPALQAARTDPAVSLRND